MARKKAAVAKAVKSNATIHDYEVIIKPVITEKSMLLMQNQNKWTQKQRLLIARPYLPMVFQILSDS